MNVAELLNSTLSRFGDPVCSSTAMSTEPDPECRQYYVFHIATHGTLFADNSPQMEIASVTINFFCPLSFPIEKRRRETRQALYEAGFTWPHTTDASDENSRNLVFECQIETEA